MTANTSYDCNEWMFYAWTMAHFGFECDTQTLRPMSGVKGRRAGVNPVVVEFEGVVLQPSRPPIHVENECLR